MDDPNRDFEPCFRFQRWKINSLELKNIKLNQSYSSVVGCLSIDCFFANPLVVQVVKHLPSSETTRDKSLAVALMEGTWVECWVFTWAKKNKGDWSFVWAKFWEYHIISSMPIKGKYSKNISEEIFFQLSTKDCRC